MISRNKQKKILEFQVDGLSAWEISQRLKIDFKTAKKYFEKFRPEIEKASKMLEKANFDENQSFLNKIPVISSLFFGKGINGPAKPEQKGSELNRAS